MGAWAYYKNGYYGFDRLTNKPIDVAVIDSGVAPVAGMKTATASTDAPAERAFVRAALDEPVTIAL
jgi:hypothetical protein